jgi:hypothetical protein
MQRESNTQWPAGQDPNNYKRTIPVAREIVILIPQLHAT